MNNIRLVRTNAGSPARKNTIIITSPSLNENLNVSGISSVTKFIINNNPDNHYIHFELGKADHQKRDFRWFMNINRSFIAWCRMLLANRNVVVHFNFAMEQRSILRDSPFIVAARLMRKKMVIHLHGGKYLMQDPPVWINRILKLVLLGREPKIVLSEFEKEMVVKRFNIEDVYVLPNSVSLIEARKYRPVYPIRGPLNLLFMGRFVESKGIRYLFEACVLLKKMQIDFRLYFAGKGREEARYVKLFSALLDKQFIFKGVVAGDDKVALMQACDVFVLPSLFGEGLPMALLECMSFGLVPVTTDDGSMGYLVKHEETGLLVKKYSAEDIAEAIRALDGDRQMLRSLGISCKDYIEDHYNPDTYIHNLNRIYTLCR